MLVNIIGIGIVLLIVFYFLNKQQRKDNEYFAEEIKLNNKEKKQLDFYKKIYKPIPKDVRLLTLKTNGVELVDIAKNATEIIYEYPIPTNDEISKLKIGDKVKIIFEDSDGYTERMWVEIRDLENEIFKGELRNDSFEFENMKYNSELYFHSNNILEIEKNNSR